MYKRQVLLTPPFINEHRKVGVGGIDVWGVKYVPGDAVGGATMPETKDFILTDIRKWRDVIKAPSLEGYDWEKMDADHIKQSGIDRNQTAVGLSLINILGTEMRLRDGRRIMGDYKLRGADVVSGARFYDCIGKSAFPAGAVHTADNHTLGSVVQEGEMCIRDRVYRIQQKGLTTIPTRCLAVCARG